MDEFEKRVHSAFDKGLESYIRSALDSGSTSEAVAEELSKVLNTIEKEKKDEEYKKKKAEEDKKAAEEEAKDEFYDAVIDEFDEHWNSGDDMTARDAALVACMIAMDNPANKDWSKEDMEQFIKDMTGTIEMALKIHEGKNTPEEQADKALKMMNDRIKDAFKDSKFGKILDSFTADETQWAKQISEALDEVVRESHKRVKRGQMTLEDWIKKQGW